MKSFQVATLFFLAAASFAAPSVAADCTNDFECKGDRVCENGKCVNSTEPAKKEAAAPQAAPAQGTTQSPAQAPSAAVFCCDSFGNRRCPLTTQLTEGASCICQGQGWGVACR